MEREDEIDSHGSSWWVRRTKYEHRVNLEFSKALSRSNLNENNKFYVKSAKVTVFPGLEVKGDVVGDFRWKISQLSPVFFFFEVIASIPKITLQSNNLFWQSSQFLNSIHEVIFLIYQWKDVKKSTIFQPLFDKRIKYMCTLGTVTFAVIMEKVCLASCSLQKWQDTLNLLSCRFHKFVLSFSLNILDPEP